MTSLRQKLLLSYALLIAGVLLGSGWSIYHFTVLGRYVRLIMSNNYRSVLDAERMKETLERQDSAMTFHIAGNDRKAVPQYETNRVLFQRSYTDAAANITEVGEPEAIRDIGAQWDAYTAKARRFLYHMPASPDSSAAYFAEMEPAFVRLKNRCDDLLQLNQDAMLRGQHRAEHEAGSASRATVGLSAVLLVLGVLYSFDLSRRLVAPLTRLTAAARRIGEGDLDLRIEEHTGDEVELLADEFTRMREVDRMKDEFISVASHELRTPLTSLQMAVRLLSEGSQGSLSAQQERLVGMAVRDAERLDRLTRDLLDLTRLEAGTAVPHRQPVSARELVEGALGSVAQPAARKTVTIDAAIEPSLPSLYGDPEQLTRVLVNLLGNALRHTPSGGTIQISAQPAAEMLEFTVRDTGEGIPVDYLPRIFDRFVQVPGATSGGAGLGLPIARKIVEAHGGTIRAESTPGRGSTFRFTVPLYRDAAPLARDGRQK